MEVAAGLHHRYPALLQILASSSLNVYASHHRIRETLDVHPTAATQRVLSGPENSQDFSGFQTDAIRLLRRTERTPSTEDGALGSSRVSETVGLLHENVPRGSRHGRR